MWDFCVEVAEICRGGVCDLAYSSFVNKNAYDMCVYDIYIYTCIYTHWVSFLIFGSENLIAEGATAVLAQVWECTSHRMPHEATCSWRSAGSDNIPNFSGFLG